MSQHTRVILVCATQGNAAHFERATLLGRSLVQFPHPLRPSLMLCSENRGPQAMGLSAIYNAAFERANDDSILVFLHDDIYIHDWQLCFHLEQALTQFDLIGVVGAAHVAEDQPGWWHILDENHQPARNDSTQRSGSINHFDPHLVRPCLYGPAPQNCDLLDGAFLAIRKSTLTQTGLRFDPQFRFHCYDTDFCHTARRMELRIGTWPIPLTHGSAGNFDRSWVEAALRLQSKLRDLAKPQLSPAINPK